MVHLLFNFPPSINMLRAMLLLQVVDLYPAAAISCPDFKATNNKITQDVLSSMAKEDIVECISYFGKEQLPLQEGKFIWDALIEERGSIEGIEDGDLRELGWILQAAPEENLYNLTLNEVDTIAALGQYHNLTETQLQVLGERVSQDWANKQAEDYTFYDLIALQHIICGFNRTNILLIHPDSYKEATGTLATLQGCPPEPLSALAALAQDTEAYGPAASWSSSQLKNVGCVMNGLTGEAIASIPPVAFEAITPDIIPCILPETLKMVNSVQLSFLTPSVVSTLTPQQHAQLSYQQQKSVEKAYEGTTTTPSCAFASKPWLLIVLFSALRVQCHQVTVVLDITCSLAIALSEK